MKFSQMWDCSPDIDNKKKEKANLCLHPCLWDLVCMSPRLRQGVPLGWNPRKRLSLYCLEDMLWKALALSDWWQWELSVWGPHSWLSKLNVVSRCTRGCTSLPRPSSVRWRNTVPLRASLRRPGEHVAVDSADLVSFFDCYTGVATNWECTSVIPRESQGWTSGDVTFT